MSIWALISVAFALAMDAFAVALAVGARLEKLSYRPVFRLSFHFGLFQFLMPIIGWLVGRQVERYVLSVDHWIALALLALIGGKMIWESFQHDGTESALADPTRKWSLIGLSIATSIDALAVGLSLALLDVQIVGASIVIGIVAAGMTLIGMRFGRALGERFGQRMELIGGLVLVAIGVRIVLQHTGVIS
ncbi:manganese efflux pump [candidate division GN15 bacterium]|uniref:Putative manganese efflux pump MntP n=1 Tax=candidate division GN15 bacterium TaxID=2072418 RepID=A0A855X5T7_9BACT|nr:MAG: manganese efflux pump [candidate division GN15 bacterium]